MRSEGNRVLSQGVLENVEEKEFDLVEEKVEEKEREEEEEETARLY